jgi:hypothetical protein
MLYTLQSLARPRKLATGHFHFPGDELAQIFAVAVGGFAIFENHSHVLVRLDLDVGNVWSDEDIVRRWARLFPPPDAKRRVRTSTRSPRALA